MPMCATDCAKLYSEPRGKILCHPCTSMMTPRTMRAMNTASGRKRSSDANIRNLLLEGLEKCLQFTDVKALRPENDASFRDTLTRLRAQYWKTVLARWRRCRHYGFAGCCRGRSRALAFGVS